MMSRSIKDYKFEMDSIEISKSFMKRTEALLEEADSVKIQPKPKISWQKITAGVSTAAACILLVFMINLNKAADENANKISLETSITPIEVTSETIYTQAGLDEQTTSESIEMIVELEDNKEAFEGLNVDEMPDIQNVLTDKASEPAAANNSAGAGNIKSTAPVVAAETQSKSSAAETTATTKNNLKSANTNSADKNTNTGAGSAQTTAELPKETSDLKVNIYSVKNHDDISESEYDEAVFGDAALAETGGRVITTVADLEMLPVIPENIVNVDFYNANLDITSYINNTDNCNMTLTGQAAEDIAAVIADIAYNSVTASNVPFSSYFSLRISEIETEAAYFDIFLTDNSTLVITRHDNNGQERTTYRLSKYDYNTIEYLLFSLFGNREEYSAFISGY